MVIKIKENNIGERIDKFLANELTNYSRSDVKILIKENH